MYQWIAKLIGKVSARTALKSAEKKSAFPAPHAAVEGLEDRKLLSMTHNLDLATLASYNYNTTLNLLHQTGVHSVRMWVNVNSFNNRGQDGSFKYIRKLHSAGIDITLSVVPRSGVRGSFSQVQSYFNWLDGTLGGSVGRWEIGNEVDKSYGGSLQSYVNNLLKPAAAALHSHGAKVISGSVSWNPLDIKTMVDAGMLNYVDYVGYHPYRSTLSDLISCVAKVKSYVGGKPLIATEWSPRGSANSADWNAKIKAFWPIIRDNFYGAYYYAAFKSGTMAGGGGLLTGSGGHNGAFYSTFSNLGSGGDGSVSAPVTTPVTTPTAPKPTAPKPTVPTTGTGTSTINSGAYQKAPTTAAATTAAKPVVTGFKLLDATTGKVLKGFEDITASETIKLKALPTRYIQVQAITSSVNSIKFSFSGRSTRVENYAPFTAFANGTGTATGWNAGVGSYTLTAIAYSGRFATGTTGNKLGVVLSFR